MDCVEEHVMRPVEVEQGDATADTYQDEHSGHEQESEHSVFTTDVCCDAEEDRSSSRASGGQANSLLKRASAAIQRATISFPSSRVPAQNEVDTILVELKNVEKHMHRLREYIRAQEDDNKPLYRWAAYKGFAALNTSVSRLKQAMAKFKATPLPQEYLRSCVQRAIKSSTSVSNASGDILAAMRKKFDDYVDELQASTLSDDAKTQASAVITEEIRKLIQHSTSATETVWHAHDKLRACEQRGNFQSWAWSVGATAMTAFIATAVSLATVYFSSPAHLDLLPARAGGLPMRAQLLDLVQQSQAVTNLTGEMYKVKFQDIDNKYDNLAAWSEAHGLRIDSIVDGLGPPNQEGIYYISSAPTSRPEETSCEDHCQEVSGHVQAQVRRQQQELETMRKNINRLDIRLTRGLEYGRKD